MIFSGTMIGEFIRRCPKRISVRGLVQLYFPLVLASCNPLAKTKFGAEFFAGVEVSPSKSEISVSEAQVGVGSAITISLELKDAGGEPYISKRDEVEFLVSGGSSVGTLGSVVNNGDGSYSASYTGLSEGTAHTITAKVNGKILDGVSSAIEVVSSDFTYDWPFAALTTTQYTSSDWSKMDFTGGLVRLSPTPQADNEITEQSDQTISSGTVMEGVVYGGLSDGSQGLKLGNGDGCDGAISNCAELSASWAPQWNSLVSYWKINGGWTDSKGTNHGTASNATLSSASKLGSHAGNFNGSNSYVTANYFSHRNLLSSDATISFWLTYNSPTDQYPTVLGSIEFPANFKGWRIFISHITDKLAFTYSSGSNGTAQAACAANTTFTSIKDSGIFTHVSVTWVSATKTQNIYINGVLDSTCNQVLQFNPSASPFLIGKYNVNHFKGTLDDIAIWSAALSEEEVRTIYSRQSAGIASKYGGIFTSRLMDAKSNSFWTDISWVTTQPFYKGLPDYISGAPRNETSEDYSSLVGSTGNVDDNDLMDGLVGLWHFNEAAGTAGAGSVKDDSGQGNHGTPSGTVTFGTAGKLSSAATFDGSTGHVAVSESSLITTQYSLSFWVKSGGTDSITVAYPFSIGNSGSLVAGLALGGSYTGSNFTGYGICLFNGTNSSCAPANSFKDANDKNIWNHIALTYDSSATQRTEIFKNGVSLATTNNVSGSLGAHNQFTFGRRADGTWFFPGAIDEVAIWNRVLHTDEVTQLYQRGASRLKYQVRSCATSPCTTEPWQGPDGTSGTYFSELNNNTVPLTGAGNVKATLPSMLFSAFTSPPANNRYFQYRSIFESDDANVALGPQLKSTSVGPVHYDASAPSIYSKTGVSFWELRAYVETLGAGGCSSGIGYNLSLDKSTWKYWDGSAWTTASGSVAQSNAASIIHTNVASFGAQVGKGTVYVKAFLRSSGTTKCELDNIQASGSR